MRSVSPLARTTHLDLESHEGNGGVGDAKAKDPVCSALSPWSPPRLTRVSSDHSGFSGLSGLTLTL